MYIIVYQTSTGLKSRYLTTHIFYNPGDYTYGGWKVLSVGILYGKKFIDRKQMSLIYQKDNLLRKRKEHFYSLFIKYFNLILKIGLFIYLVKELFYKFFIYIANK